MPDFMQFHVRCALCGAASLRPRVGGADASGSPDLDLRPPEPVRSLLAFRVECCEDCGYCWRALGEAPPGAAAAIASPVYLGVLRETRMPLLARRLFCAALVAEAAPEMRDRAAWGFLEAAWACDDAGATEPARTCRERAAEAFLSALEWCEAGSSPANVKTLVADVLRRAGRFDDALALLDEAETLASAEASDDASGEQAVDLVIRFSRSLCEAADTDPHMLAEAFADHD